MIDRRRCEVFEFISLLLQELSTIAKYARIALYHHGIYGGCGDARCHR